MGGRRAAAALRSPRAPRCMVQATQARGLPARRLQAGTSATPRRTRMGAFLRGNLRATCARNWGLSLSLTTCVCLKEAGGRHRSARRRRCAWGACKRQAGRGGVLPAPAQRTMRPSAGSNCWRAKAQGIMTQPRCRQGGRGEGRGAQHVRSWGRRARRNRNSAAPSSCLRQPSGSAPIAAALSPSPPSGASPACPWRWTPARCARPGWCSRPPAGPGGQEEKKKENASGRWRRRTQRSSGAGLN